MKKVKNGSFFTAACLFAAFLIYTLALCFVDVQEIGPNGTAVGFATVNQFVHKLTGTHVLLYILTDWLSLVPLGLVMVFGFMGLLQWIKRKSFFKVDRSLFVLGGFYITVMAAFLFFEKVIINYRPILIDGLAEASYPSSTTVLVLCVMPTATMQLNSRIKSIPLKRCTTVASIVFVIFMVASRLLSGVHWVSDIVGGVLLSSALVSTYRALCQMSEDK